MLLLLPLFTGRDRGRRFFAARDYDPLSQPVSTGRFYAKYLGQCLPPPYRGAKGTCSHRVSAFISVCNALPAAARAPVDVSDVCGFFEFASQVL